MKIYVDSTWRICALNHTDRTDLREIEIDNREEAFGSWCDSALFCFQYAPSYEWDVETEDYVKDENGDMIQAGWCFSPVVDFNIIESIQLLYEKEIQILKESNEDLILAVADILGGAL